MHKTTALRFVLMIGVVSFFADFTYEGSRSITGPYLAMLGASATAVGFVLALLGAGLWGLGMGVHESIIPAAVATMVPAQRRPSAYGLFTAAYGLFWFLGSALVGFLYDVFDCRSDRFLGRRGTRGHPVLPQRWARDPRSGIARCLERTL